jgi:hypothetical protein
MLLQFSIDFVRPCGGQRATKGGVLGVGRNLLQQQSAKWWAIASCTKFGIEVRDNKTRHRKIRRRIQTSLR